MSKRMLGDIAIDVAIEVPVDDGFPPELLVPNHDPALLEANKSLIEPFCRNPVTGGLKLSIHTWIVKTRNQVILIDTCNGNHKERPSFELAHHLNTIQMHGKSVAACLFEQRLDLLDDARFVMSQDHCGQTDLLPRKGGIAGNVGRKQARTVNRDGFELPSLPLPNFTRFEIGGMLARRNQQCPRLLGG